MTKIRVSLRVDAAAFRIFRRKLTRETYKEACRDTDSEVFLVTNVPIYDQKIPDIRIDQKITVN